jgi:hypothetical protein
MRQRDETYSSIGMAGRHNQRVTLGRFVDKLTTKGWRDVGLVVLSCPSVLSPFGTPILWPLVRRPRRWPFAVTYGLWWAHHQCGRRPGRSRRIASHVAWAVLQAVLATLRPFNRLVLPAQRL